MKKYIVKSVNILLQYDEDTKEIEIESNLIGTIDELIADAKIRCESEQQFDDYFNTMKMDVEPFNVATDVENGEGYVDVTYHFTENGYTAAMDVSYMLEEER